MPITVLGGTTSAAAAYEIANSVRFNDGDSPSLRRTIPDDESSTGNRNLWTFSTWLKRGQLGTQQAIFGSYQNSNYHTVIEFNTSDQLNFFDEYNGSKNGQRTTSRVFRDCSSWYHIVCVWDKNNGTDALKMRVFVNGTEESAFATNSVPSNAGTLGADDQDMSIGERETVGQNFDGYFAETFFVDGTAYAASAFGEFDEDSPTIWKPKDCSGDLTFGTNGFWLDYEDSGTLGNDANGGTDYTATNLAAADQCIDSPTNNLCTLNPLHMSDPSANYFVDNGNNTLEATNNDQERQTGATIHPQGIKGYFEFKILTDNNWRVALLADGAGLAKDNYTALASGQQYGLDSSGNLAYSNDGSSTYLTSGYTSSPANGNIIGCAFDFTGSNRNVWFHLNGTYGNNGSGVGVPADGDYPGLTSTQLSTANEYEFVFVCNTGGSSASIGLNFGNGSFDGTAISSAGTNASFGSFEYNVPSGFGPICTKTLNGTYS